MTIRRSSPHRCSFAVRGFTLIELMVTLTVAAIMLGVGIPSFKSFIASQKVKSAAYDLTTSLMIARSEALKRNASVTVAPDTADTWTAGWTVKVGTTTLQQQSTMSGVTITKAASAASIPSTFVYGGSGRLTSAASAQYLQINGTSLIKCVKIDSTGIPTTQTVACP